MMYKKKLSEQPTFIYYYLYKTQTCIMHIIYTYTYIVHKINLFFRNMYI